MRCETSHKGFCATCFSVWGHAAALLWEFSAGSMLWPRNFSKHRWFIFVALCGVSWLSPASLVLPGSVKQFRKGPILQMVVWLLPWVGLKLWLLTYNHNLWQAKALAPSKAAQSLFSGAPVSAVLPPSCRSVTSWSMRVFAAETRSRFMWEDKTENQTTYR